MENREFGSRIQNREREKKGETDFLLSILDSPFSFSSLRDLRPARRRLVESVDRAVRRLGPRAHGPLANRSRSEALRRRPLPPRPAGALRGGGRRPAFGRSLPARVALAAAIALLHLAGLSALSRRMLTGGRAALAVSAAVAAAVFLRPGGWMFPFSFDTAIAVAALTWSVELFLRGSDSAAAACLLAALLSRPEMGAVGAALLAFSARREPRRLAATRRRAGRSRGRRICGGLGRNPTRSAGRGRLAAAHRPARRLPQRLSLLCGPRPAGAAAAGAGARRRRSRGRRPPC